MNGGIVYTMGMEDRFSDYGIVGVAIVTDTDTDSWEIDSFMLSCRAFGRNIERELLAAVLADAAGAGVGVVRARYAATEKNGMTRDFFPGNGFTLTGRTDGELRFRSDDQGSPRADRPRTVPGIATGAFDMTGDASQALQRIFRSVLKVGPDTEITALSMDSHGGWDSIAHLNLILAVEQEFRFMMTPEEAAAVRSFRDMMDLVESR